jgi:hypothetical protein
LDLLQGGHISLISKLNVVLKTAIGLLGGGFPRVFGAQRLIVTTEQTPALLALECCPLLQEIFGLREYLSRVNS